MDCAGAAGRRDTSPEHNVASEHRSVRDRAPGPSVRLGRLRPRRYSFRNSVPRPKPPAGTATATAPSPTDQGETSSRDPPARVRDQRPPARQGFRGYQTTAAARNVALRRSWARSSDRLTAKIGKIGLGTPLSRVDAPADGVVNWSSSLSAGVYT